MDKHYYYFRKTNTRTGVTMNSEHFYACEEDARWDDVMRQFAAFLDSCGYVGVYEKVDLMLDKFWEVE